jgi:hypothetical protein
MEKKGPEYDQLNKFVGHWSTEGKIRASGSTPEANVSGTDSYEWLPGGFFLLHKADASIGDVRTQTTEIIGFDQTYHGFIMRHFDSKGSSGLMIASCIDDAWTFLGETLRFTGGFKKGHKEFSGIWEKSSDKKNWVPFMDIKLTRVDP